MLEEIIYKFESDFLQRMGVHFLNLREIDSLVEKLTEQVLSSDFHPELVVGILKGGYYSAKKLAQSLNTNHAFIHIAREETKILGIYAGDILGLSRILRLGEKKPALKEPAPDFNNYKKILIMDDDSWSGETLEIAETEIRKNRNVEKLKKAVLVAYPLGTKPDYFAQRGGSLNHFVHSRIRFPWKRYSPHFRDYQKAVNGAPLI